MGKVYNLSGRISNQLPVVVVTDEVTLTVNNRVDNMLLVRKYINDKQKLMAENNIKASNGEEVEEIDEVNLMFGTLDLLVGKKNSAALKELNLPITEFKDVYSVVMAAAQGTDPDDVDFGDEKEEATFQK